MAKVFQITIITPQESFAPREVVFAGFEGADGRLTVEADHAPMICTLAEGSTVLRNKDGNEQWNTGKGFLKVSSNQVTMLVHHAAMAQ